MTMSALVNGYAFGGVVKNPYRYWDDAERDRLSGH
jgi:hypothetical protein